MVKLLQSGSLRAVLHAVVTNRGFESVLGVLNGLLSLCHQFYQDAL